MSRNLTPIMLALGPLMLVGAFFSWPLTNEVGMDGVALLRDDASMNLAVAVSYTHLTLPTSHLV